MAVRYIAGMMLAMLSDSPVMKVHIQIGAIAPHSGSFVSASSEELLMSEILRSFSYLCALVMKLGIVIACDMKHGVVLGGAVTSPEA